MGHCRSSGRFSCADLSWCYPYVTSDSYDWIANGLSWAGENVAASWRPPGLPLLIAALFKLGLLSWLPVVNVLVLGLTTAALYLLLRERHGAWISACASWFFFANDYVQDLTKYLLADIYCTLFIVLAALFFARAARDPRHYRTSSLLLGVGYLFHNATAVAGIGLAVAFLLTRRGDLRRREVWQGLGGAAFFAGGWTLARELHYHLHPGARSTTSRRCCIFPRRTSRSMRSRVSPFSVWPYFRSTGPGS